MADRKWMRTQPHDVYTIVDANDSALYVGLSMNTERRLLQHRSKEWFSSAVSVFVVTYKDWADAKKAEGLAIRELNPTHNSQREAWSAAAGEANPPSPITGWGREL